MLLDYTCLNIQTNIVPYGREEGYLGESVPGRNIAAAPPGSGTFEIGAVIENSATVDRSGGALDSREQAEDRSRDSDGGRSEERRVGKESRARGWRGW